jgi:hypothetical protein
MPLQCVITTHARSQMPDLRWFVGDVWWLFDDFIMLLRGLRLLLRQVIAPPSGSGWHFQKLLQITKMQKMNLKLKKMFKHNYKIKNDKIFLLPSLLASLDINYVHKTWFQSEIAVPVKNHRPFSGMFLEMQDFDWFRIYNLCSDF